MKTKDDKEYRLCDNVSLLHYETVSDDEAFPKTVTVRITADEDFDGVLRFALKSASGDREKIRFFLPGFMYGTNRGDAPLVVDSKTPCMRMSSEFPASEWWMVRSDRLSHPVALMFADGHVTGFSASPYYITDGERKPWYPGESGSFDQYAGFGCSLENGEVWYTLGYENAPWMFVDSHTIQPQSPMGHNCFRISKGESVAVTLYCFDFTADDERGIQDVIKWTYRRFHEEPRRSRSVSETVRDISEAVMRDAWMSDTHSYAGFVFDRGDHFEYRALPSISWTNGLSAAVPMLASSCRLGNDKMRIQAVECIDHIVSESMNEKNDLPYLSEQGGVWSNRGWWYDKQRTPGHAAYLVGQSVYLILKAYALEKDNGTDHEDWLLYAHRVLERTEKGRNSDGEYPYVFSEDTGAGLEYDSFSGAWCLAAAAYYGYLTGDHTYVPALLNSEKWYYDKFVKHEECYGGPLDIDKKTDSEGILSYIRALRYLHEALSEQNDAERDILLDHLRDALYYEYTFKFCYNSPIKIPPLSKVGWSSCGGSITSVTNPHIHPMSSSVIDEMMYYLRFRDDEYVRSRLNDTVLWSCQCHNTYDGEYDYGKRGWMSERFCHSEGLLTERYPDGSPASTWFALMPWACGSILEGLTSTIWDNAFTDRS
ncbi:MAG: hypothetical protein K6G22_05190 [Lachnospiraceae bacterium]|nr:hypothetical protein [Lachnospiraceae bacterium]